MKDSGPQVDAQRELPRALKLAALLAGGLCLLWLINSVRITEAPDPPPPPEMTIRVQPVAAPVEPETVQMPPVLDPAPEPVAAPVAPLEEVSSQDAPVPERLPAISASYAESIGFTRYVQAMEALGGRFFIYDDTRNRLLHGFSPLTGKTAPVDPASLRGLSPRLRELSYEPAVEAVLNRYRITQSRSRIKWVLLLPREVETSIAAQLSGAIQNGNLPPGEWSRADATYRMSGGRLVLHLVQLRGSAGVQSVDFSLRL